MNEAGRHRLNHGGVAAQYYARDFWSLENLKYVEPHYRMQKAARIIRRLAEGGTADLLDIGCGPATLMRLLPSNVRYHGIDIAIHNPAPNLLEADIVKGPISFGDERFDMILAQGFFEYVGEYQSRKFAEIARLLKEEGIFITSYVNFGHRQPAIYSRYSNVRPIDEFSDDLARHFSIRRFFPTSHNWAHSEPNRKILRAANMHLNLNIPYITEKLAVQYFFICTPRV